MSVIIPPGFGLAAFYLTAAVGTPPYVTTIGVDMRGWSASDVEAANAAFAAYAGGPLTVTSVTLTLAKVTLSVGQDGPGGSVDSDAVPVNGSVSVQNRFPIQGAPVMRKVTDQLGRAGRGRMFWPGILDDSEVGILGDISAPTRTALTAKGDTFLQSLETPSMGGTLPAVLLHSDGSIPPTPITGLICQQIVGWLRYRGR